LFKNKLGQYLIVAFICLLQVYNSKHKVFAWQTMADDYCLLECDVICVTGWFPTMQRN